MADNNLKTILTHIVFIALILSLFGVGFLAFRDVFRTPEENLQFGLNELTKQNYKSAEQALIRASSADDKTDKNTVMEASWTLGNLYRKGEKDFPVNGRKAEMLLERAATLGYAPAQYELALMYDVGDKIPANKQKAIAWMNYAAQAGLPEALYGLGVWAERGYMGQPNQEKILILYEQAAQKGYVNAMKSLVVLYGNELAESPQNVERANYWLEQLKQLQNK